MEIAVLGDNGFTLGFRLAGVRLIYDKSGDIHALLKDESIGLVIVSSDYFGELDEQARERVVRSIKPVCVVLAEKPQEELRQMIIRSIGVDLLKGDSHGK